MGGGGESEDLGEEQRFAALCVLKKPPHTLSNSLQLVLTSHKPFVLCVVCDYFLSEQWSFQPLGEKRRGQKPMPLKQLALTATSFSLPEEGNFLLN